MLSRLLSRSMFACALIAVLGSIAVIAQGPYPRIKIIEEFTSATCPPCRFATPNINEMTDLDKGVVSIRYHMHYPAPNDPWNLNNPVEASARHTFYNVQGIPAGSANGNPVLNPSGTGDVATMKAQLAALSATTPVQITLTQDGGKVKVRVRSDIAITGHTLHVVMVSRYISVPDIASRLQGSASNGETEFEDIMNKMYPDQNGTPLTLAAGGDQTFEFTPAIGGGIVFPAGQQYMIGFIQSNATKAIIQGGVSANLTAVPRTYTFLSRSAVQTSVATLYNRVARGTTEETDVTVTNLGTVQSTATLSVGNSTVLQTLGVNAEIMPATVVLAPNESKVVKLKVTAPSDRSAFFGVEPAISATDGIAGSASAVYYLIGGARVVNYYGLGSATWTVTTVASLNSTYGADVVYMPFATDILGAYPATEFDAAILAFGVTGRTSLQSTVLTTVQGMLNSGKGVWLSGQANMYTMFDQGQLGGNSAVQSTRNFYNDVLGIDYVGLRFWIVNNTLKTFTVNGVVNDSIGGAIPQFTANQRSANWQTYAEVSDVMRLTATSKAKPWHYYNDSATVIGGIHVITPTGGRAVYSSLDLASVFSETTRNLVTQQVLNWLLLKSAALAPILTLNTATLQFGQVQIASTKDMTLPIRNTGTSNLIITNMAVVGMDSASFVITSGAPTDNDITVAPNTTHNVTVRFAPTVAKTDYIAAIEFSSNAALNPIAQLHGIGVTSSVETDVVSETGAIGLRLIGANPVTEATEVELRSLTNTTVTIVDQSGRIVSTIFNGTTSGTQHLSLRSSALAAGTYTVVASNGSESAVLSIVVVR